MNDPQQPSTESGLRRAAQRGDDEDDRQNKKPRCLAHHQQHLVSPLVLQAVAASQFLTTKELGRLLLLSSKELTASAFFSSSQDNDDGDKIIWTSLCVNHLGQEDGQPGIAEDAPAAPVGGTVLPHDRSRSTAQVFSRTAPPFAFHAERLRHDFHRA